MKIGDLITQFTSYLLTEKRVSKNTFIAYKQDLAQLHEYYLKKGLSLSLPIERTQLNNFLAHLKERGLSARSMSRKIAAIKGLCAYGVQRYQIEDYAKEIVSPKIKKSLPDYLSIEELEKLFQAAEQDRSVTGIRNKVMLFLMYVTGMRVSELIAVNIAHVHRDAGFIAINGKGGRQRLVPIPDSMMQELVKYIDDIRPTLLEGRLASDYLFPVIYGKKVKTLTRQALWSMIKQLWKKATIDRPISPHTLRHSFATHMLNKGANLRSLQILLGHEQLSTVQVYTHVETRHLRAIYDKKHPRSQ